MKGLSSTAEKVLLILAGGLALGLNASPGRHTRILKLVAKEWRAIERRKLSRAIQRLYESKLVDYVENQDGSISAVLNRSGKRVALRYKIDELHITKPKQWDKKWRVILFDIPETQKRLRDVLRGHLKNLGLMEFQKSVFVHPYECKNEIDFIIEIYDARRYVRFIEAYHIDNGLHLKKKFKLI